MLTKEEYRHLELTLFYLSKTNIFFFDWDEDMMRGKVSGVRAVTTATFFMAHVINPIHIGLTIFESIENRMLRDTGVLAVILLREIMYLALK